MYYKLMQRWAPKVFLVTLRLVQFDVRPRPQLRKPNTAMQVLCLQGQCDWGSGCLAFPAKLASPQPDIDLVSKIVWGYESISSLKRQKHLVNLHLPSQTKVASILWHPWENQVPLLRLDVWPLERWWSQENGHHYDAEFLLHRRHRLVDGSGRVSARNNIVQVDAYVKATWNRP